jgi:predicted transposase/invertase (TIGR01784 family)
MDFEFSGMGHTNVKSDVILYDLENQMKFTDKLRFIYLEMPKFNKTEAELESNYDKWLYLLKNISDLDEVPAKLQKVLFEKVFNIAEVSNYTPKDRKQYEESLKEYRDYYNTIATAEKEAREEGWQEGREEGREEEKVGVAEKAIIEGFDDQVIQKLTGLSIEQIDELRRKLGK